MKTHSITLRGALTTVVLGLAAGIASHAQSFSLTGDWSDTANPNGPWSYNKGNDPLPHVDDWLGTGPAYAITGIPAPGHIPAIFKRSDTDGSYVFMHAWDGGNGLAFGAPNVTWTSSSIGYADVSGFGYTSDFGGRSGIWSISVDNTQVTNGALSAGDPYDRTNPFDFATGSGGATILNHIPVTSGTVIKLQWDGTSTAGAFFYGDLAVNVTAVPELSNYATVAGMGLLAFAASRRIRKV